jgi:hypothetical protein
MSQKLQEKFAAEFAEKKVSILLIIIKYKYILISFC